MELKAYPFVNVGNKNQTPEIEFFLYCLEKLLALKPVFVAYTSKLLELWVPSHKLTFSLLTSNLLQGTGILYICLGWRRARPARVGTLPG